MTRPRLLDLFCGAGGAAMGYHRAGFDVTGVDIRSQPSYPFEFVQGDALEALRLLADGTWQFDAIHASPPCQFATQMNASWRSRGLTTDRIDMLTPTRVALLPLGVPYVIENVVGAKRYFRPNLMLHGGMFGLEVHRPRLFECSELILAPKTPINHKPVGVYGDHPEPNGRTRLNGGRAGTRSVMRVARDLEEAQRAMGMPWADWHGCKEAIPPAYTAFIGAQLLAALAVRT
jgi:DNA (cytosine-5)-methyltransferase 1